MSILLYFALLCAILFALYLFMAAPTLRKTDAAYTAHDYAHRGLFDHDSMPENSLAAYQHAIDMGYGIELDVQLSKDNQLIVFHDATLKRVCGRNERVADLTLAQLQACQLFGSDQYIPSFKETLHLVAGQAPLIIELKAYGSPKVLARLVYEMLAGYSGGYVVQSFHPLAMRWFKVNAPRVIRGQLAYGKSSKPTQSMLDRCLKYLLCNFLSRPDYIAYDVRTDQNLAMTLMTTLFHPVLIGWTVRSQADRTHARKRYDCQIFEGFLPKD